MYCNHSLLLLAILTVISLSLSIDPEDKLNQEKSLDTESILRTASKDSNHLDSENPLDRISNKSEYLKAKNHLNKDSIDGNELDIEIKLQSTLNDSNRLDVENPLRFNQSNRNKTLDAPIEPIQFNATRILKLWSPSLKVGKSKDLTNFIVRIRDRGVKSFNYIHKKVIKKLNSKTNITNQVKIVTNDFESKIQNYFDYINAQIREQHEIDIDYMFLDILETACRLIYREQTELFNKAAVEANLTKTVRKYMIDNMKKIIYKRNQNFKEEELQYICTHYGVCRPYSKFTVYFERFINEMMTLPDDKLLKFVIHLRGILKSNEDFAALVSVKANDEDIIKELDEFPKSTRHLKKSLSVLKAIVAQRFKIIRSPNPTLRLRIQALRQLLDILDLAFYNNYDNNFNRDFNTTLNAIKTWSNTEEWFIQEEVGKFIDTVLKEISLSENTMKYACIEALVTGRIRDDKTYYTKFKDGFKGVYGDD